MSSLASVCVTDFVVGQGLRHKLTGRDLFLRNPGQSMRHFRGKRIVTHHNDLRALLFADCLSGNPSGNFIELRWHFLIRPLAKQDKVRLRRCYHCCRIG